jgi:hypothetical protein
MKTFVSILAALLLPAVLLADDSKSASPLMSPTEKVAGMNQELWSREWWQWAGSFEQFDSPVADRSGIRCGLKQSGAVWFLAGTYGTRRTIRTCTIPAGKHLFFPLINYVVSPRYTNSLTCEQAKTMAASMTDNATSLVLELDGKLFKGLSTHRQATIACFDVAGRVGGGVAPSAANGYYVMLRPLSRGTHTLNFGGILPDDMSQAVTYTLHVE